MNVEMCDFNSMKRIWSYTTCKVSKLLNLTESSLLVLSFILLAGDINPQPGPANVLDVPTLDFKARGLSVLHLNV